MNFFAGKKRAPPSRRQQEGATKGRKGAKIKFSITEIYPCFVALIDFKHGCPGTPGNRREEEEEEEDEDEEVEEEEEEEEEEEDDEEEEEDEEDEEEGAGGGGNDDDEDDDDEEERNNLSNGMSKLQKRRGPSNLVASKSKKVDKVTSFA